MSEAAQRIYVNAEFTHKVTERHETDIEYIRADLVAELMKLASTANDLMQLNNAVLLHIKTIIENLNGSDVQTGP